jgi:hypothetical protein
MVDVLFSLGDWRIKRTKRDDLRGNLIWRYYACHWCSYEAIGSWWIDEQPVCGVCKEPVPDEIQGLLQMILTER